MLQNTRRPHFIHELYKFNLRKLKTIYVFGESPGFSEGSDTCSSKADHPKSLIARCLQKIQTDCAEGLMIVPMWPTQSWYPKLLRMLVAAPRVLPQQRTALQMPGMPQEVHPYSGKWF